MPTVENITLDERLGEAALDLLLGNPEEQKLLITNRARWIKTTLRGNRIYSKKHIKLEKHLRDIAREYDNHIYKGFNAKVVLLRDPTPPDAENAEGIKLIMKAGADVRFLKSSSLDYRVVISGNRIFFSFCDSDNKELVVNRGLLYTGDSGKRDCLIEYFESSFNKLYNKGHPLTIDRRDRIIFSNGPLSRGFKAYKDIAAKDYILLIWGGILGAVLGLLLKL